MPTIAFVSPKGGVGKTTSAFLLATAFARICDVTIADADPNHPIETWALGGSTPDEPPCCIHALNRLKIAVLNVVPGLSFPSGSLIPI